MVELEIFNILVMVMILENDYVVGIGIEIVGYIVNGDFDDWMYGEIMEKLVIYFFMLEVGWGGVGGGFWLVIDDIIFNCWVFLWMNLVMVEVLYNFGIVCGDVF